VVNGVLDDYDALTTLLETIEHFLNRLDIYTRIDLTDGITDMIVKILVELLSTLALVTKQIQQGKFSESVLSGILYYSNYATQKQLSRKRFLEGRTSRRYSRDWVDSRWMRLG